MPNPTITLQAAQAALSPEEWATRVAAADSEAEAFDRVLKRVGRESPRCSALQAEFPDTPRSTAYRRLRRYEAGGRDALINLRLTKPRDAVVTDEVMARVQGMLAVDPDLRAPQLRQLLLRQGFDVGESTLRAHLASRGLSHPVGRPAGSKSKKVEPLSHAGLELLKAVETEVGAVEHLTTEVGRYLEQLPAPEGEVLDDRGHRDEEGKFLPSYNAAKERTEPELGGKFDTVARRRGEKDLRNMRLANSSFAARHRKDLALTLLPAVVDAPRWSVLKHWQGEHLGAIAGFPYRPATLDKHARELKLSGAAEVAREAVAAFWSRVEGPFPEPATGALIIYGDTATKPLWTHHFTRCTKVAKLGGRIMPATSTIVLNSGCGTPLVYRSFSGHVALPGEVCSLLEEYDKAAGKGTAKRVIVLDREAHATWLFKELDAREWLFVVPLRKQVVGNPEHFEELGEWQSYNEAGDEVREAFLWLNDSRKGEDRMRVRVVGRKRHRSAKVSWYATNTSAKQFTTQDVVRIYFDRWPAQEHVFRDANGRIGFDAHYGYGKKKIMNVAVLDKLDKLEGQLRRTEVLQAAAQENTERLTERLDNWDRALQVIQEALAEIGEAVDAAVGEGRTEEAEFHEQYEKLRIFQRWLPEALEAKAQATDALDVARCKSDQLEKTKARLVAERERLQRRTEIFTVDTELDEIMTAYKLTYMNLASRLMRMYLDERMEMDTLIRGVLTLPGERVRTKKTETVRIYRQPRDERAMRAVEQACERLTAKGLVRDKRTLRFEVVDKPAA